MRSKFLLMAAVAMLSIATFAADSTPKAKAPSGPTVPSFQVTDANGTVVNSADIIPEGKWLLIYVRANNRPSEQMLSQLKAEKYASYFDRIVFIVNGVDAAGLSDWLKKFPDLANAHWYLDPKREAFTKLNLHGVPVEMGVNGVAVDWNLSGMPSEGDTFDSTLLTWIKQ